MAKGAHKGKVVVKLRDEKDAAVTEPSPFKVPALARSFCYSSGVYLVTGGLGGMGLAIALFLVKRKARKFVLLFILCLTVLAVLLSTIKTITTTVWVVSCSVFKCICRCCGVKPR